MISYLYKNNHVLLFYIYLKDVIENMSHGMLTKYKSHEDNNVTLSIYYTYYNWLINISEIILNRIQYIYHHEQ